MHVSPCRLPNYILFKLVVAQGAEPSESVSVNIWRVLRCLPKGNLINGSKKRVLNGFMRLWHMLDVKTSLLCPLSMFVLVTLICRKYCGSVGGGHKCIMSNIPAGLQENIGIH